MKIVLVAIALSIFLVLSVKIPVKSETFDTCIFTDDIKKSRFSIIGGEKSTYDEVKPVLPDVGETCADLMGWKSSQTKKLYLL